VRQPGDAERVVRAVGGDGEAFAELVAQYRDAVYGVCYHRVGHPEDATDLAQEAFLRAYLDLRQLRDPVAFPVWLRRVAERVCATWQRRRRFEAVPPEEAPEPSQERDLDLPMAIQHALAQLSDGARLAVTLYPALPISAGGFWWGRQGTGHRRIAARIAGGT
jgi:RNA polymerase sigma factor (sigma-70 family)